jgi:hypothetical protein
MKVDELADGVRWIGGNFEREEPDREPIDYRAAFPFHCPWRVEPDLPNELPGGSVGPARAARRVRIVRDDGSVGIVERPVGFGFDDGDDDDDPTVHWFLDCSGLNEYSTDADRYSALADVIGGDNPTIKELSAAFHDAAMGQDRDELDDAESALLSESWMDKESALRKALFRYYRHRCDNVTDAIDWCASETLTSVIHAVLRGSLAVPANASEWIGAARAVRAKYWRENGIVVDGQPVQLFDSDDELATAIKPARLRLDDDALMNHLISLWQLGAQRDDVPRWVEETVCLLVTLPGASGAECAEICGVKWATWKARVNDLRKAIRFGALIDLID